MTASLLLGLGSVAAGQAVVLTYYLYQYFIVGVSDKQRFHNDNGPPLPREIWAHVCSPESFGLVFLYLSLMWHGGLMLTSYYDDDLPFSLWEVIQQLLVVDAVMYVVHRLEHTWQLKSHRPHHVFTRPRLLHAFQGSLGDTTLLILWPLACTSQLVPASYWSYMVFGTVYSSYFVLIHCEFAHPFDPWLRRFGIATTQDHQCHHKYFHGNFGHFFTYWDRLGKTYIGRY